MKCQVCGNSNHDLKYEINGYKIMICRECNHSFAENQVDNENVYKIYSDKYFFEGKSGYPDYFLEKDILIRRGEMYAKKMKKYLPPGTCLDVGAAAGFIMKGFENTGWNVKGIEPNAVMAKYGTEKLGLNMLQGTIETVNLDQKYELVTLIQVIAHLFDLSKSMLAINRAVKKGGYILVETWNKDSLTANIFGQNWHEYSPPSTLNFFSKKTLDLLMKKYGFNRIAGGTPEKKIHAKHAKALFRHKMGGSKFLKYLQGIEKIVSDKWYLNYPADDLFWALYQKSDNIDLHSYSRSENYIDYNLSAFSAKVQI